MHKKGNFYSENTEAIKTETYRIVSIFTTLLENRGIDTIMKIAYKNADEFKIQLEKEKKVLCKKGCSFCCHDKIIMSQLEATYFLSKLKSVNISPNIERLQKQNKIKFEKLKWQDKACSFLGKDGICTIYEMRPLICRTHNNIGNSVNDCDKSENSNKTVFEAYTIETTALSMALFLLSKKDIGVTIHELLKNTY